MHAKSTAPAAQPVTWSETPVLQAFVRSARRGILGPSAALVRAHRDGMVQWMEPRRRR